MSISKGVGQKLTFTVARLSTANTASTSASGTVTSQWISFTESLVLLGRARGRTMILRLSPSRQARWANPAYWRRWRERSLPLVEPLAQLLAGLEEGNVLFADLHAFPGTRVATHARAAPLDRESAEAAQLDPVAARQGRRDLVEDGGNDAFDVALVKVRIALGQMLDQLGFGHGAAFAPLARVNLLENVPNPAPIVKDGGERRPAGAGLTCRPSRPCRRPCGPKPRRGCRRARRRCPTSRIRPSPACPRRFRAP